jgi:very-short-patch-repair endonuclease
LLRLDSSPNSISQRSIEFAPPFSREETLTRFNRTRLKTGRARELRRSGTGPEAKLWQVLRGRPLGHSFRRQHPVGPYILDFYCPALKLAIELDGDQHLEHQSHDIRRTHYLDGKGIRVIRFWNIEVNENFDGVCERIAEIIGKMTPTRNATRSDLPLSGGGIMVR